MMTNGTIPRRGVAGLSVGLMLLASAGLRSQEPSAIQGTLADGSHYRAVMPGDWNGTLVLDLDFANNLEAPPSAVEQWMTRNGFAIGGISREPVAYRFRQAVDDLLDVQEDLRTLAASHRLGADPVVVEAAERLTSYSGRIRGPVIVVDNIGDPVDSDAFKRAYARTVERAGNAALLRTTWVRSTRHANQSALEKLTGLVTLLERLDTGTWGDTTPQMMNVRASALETASDIDLGPARFVDHTAPAMLRPWDGSNWGTYASCPGQQLSATDASCR